MISLIFVRSYHVKLDRDVGLAQLVGKVLVISLTRGEGLTFMSILKNVGFVEVFGEELLDFSLHTFHSEELANFFRARRSEMFSCCEPALPSSRDPIVGSLSTHHHCLARPIFLCDGL